MTEDHDFKELVRARMARTGESYSTARMRVLRSSAEDDGHEVVAHWGTDQTGSGSPRRRLLILSAEGHVTVQPTTGAKGEGSLLEAAGLVVQNPDHLEELRVDEDRIRVVSEGHLVVGLLHPDFDLEIEAEGHVNVSGLAGRISVTTSDGQVVLSGRLLDPLVETGDGNVAIDGGRGRASVSTGDGHVRLSGEFSEVEVETGDGSVTIDGGRGRASVSTGDGHVRLSGEFSEVEVETGDGDVFVDSLTSGSISSCDGQVELVLGGSAEPRIEVIAERVTGNVNFFGREDMWVSEPAPGEKGRLRVETTGRVVIRSSART